MIRLIRECELEFLSQPFAGREDQVYYIESEFNTTLNKFVQENLPKIKRLFGKEMLDFVYVRKEDSPVAEGMGRGSGTMVSSNAYCPGDGAYRFRAYHIELPDTKHSSWLMHEFQEIAKAYSRKGIIDYGQYTTDTETAVLLQEMENIARALKLKGVKSELFDEMVSALEQPVPLVVSRFGKVHLHELGNLEVKMDAKQLALYVLFLKHPEGLLADEVVGHRSELLKLYRQYTHIGDPEKHEAIVDSLLSEEKGDLYTNINRIKTSFTNSLGPRLARHYIIARSDEDGKYRIALPEEMWLVE